MGGSRVCRTTRAVTLIAMLGLVSGLLATTAAAATASTGTVVAWGLDDDGQTDVPAGLSGVTAIAAGLFHSLALKDDGTVVAWGRDIEGQTDVPSGLSNVTAISAGGYHSLALVGATQATCSITGTSKSEDLSGTS